jgi:hypothetical protein
VKISDIELGSSHIIEIQPLGRNSFDQSMVPLSEVNLFPSDFHDSAILQVKRISVEVEGVDPHNKDQLEKLFARNLPQLSWIVSTPSKDGQSLKSLLLETHEFPSEYFWPDCTDFAIDDKLLERIRLKRRSLVSIEDAINWLTNKLIGILSDGTQFILVSGSPSGIKGNNSSFRIHGKGFMADIVSDNENRLLVSRIVENRQKHDDEKHPVFLIKGKFRFIDHTIAGSFKGNARLQLEQIVADSDSYLKIWREYNDIESQKLLGEVRQFGWLRYNKCLPQKEGDWLFKLQVNEGPELQEQIHYLMENGNVEIEVSAQLPEEIINKNSSISFNSGKKKPRVFAGECISVDSKNKTLLLHQPSDFSYEDRRPPEKGFIFLSWSGDRKRIERRKRAQSLIASAECPMPQLGLLIEGKKVPERRRKQIKGMSRGVREVFGAEPTARQQEALKIALNTPDIALIQGPPGTGKTKIITALIKRFSEISEDTMGISGRYLLTSYQHDAVENVADATQVFGLPTTKIGKKRGKSEGGDGFDRWRLDKIEEINSKLAEFSETPLELAYKKCRDITLAYIESPHKNEDLTKILQDITDFSKPYLSPQLSDEILNMKELLSRTKDKFNPCSIEYSLALKALYSLRVDPISFSDDGPRQAYKVLSRVQDLNILGEEQLNILRGAADWDSEDEPPFLEQLEEIKNSLLDKLSGESNPSNQPLVNQDFRDLLVTVVGALHEKIRTGKSGVPAILYEYKEDLETDIEGSREAVEQYTTVLAATCQQSVGYEMEKQKNNNVVFESVIVDEAARANPLDLSIPMSCAERRIILVGDHRQLPHLLEPDIERELDAGMNEKMEEMLKKSMFERLFKEMRKREFQDGIKRTVSLDVQYRMHPLLGKFVSDTFYKPHGEAFNSGLEKDFFRHDLSPYGEAVAAWVDLPRYRGAESGRKSKKRIIEAHWIAKEVHRCMREREDLSFGVISFYSSQVNELLSQMKSEGLTEQLEDGSFRISEKWRLTRDSSGKLIERLRVGTVDAFQGKEFDVVFLSMTRSNDYSVSDLNSLRRKYGHLMLENRLCVAMSRQKKLLVVVGDSEMLKVDEASGAVRGLCQFLKLCGGENGIII